MEFYDPDVAPDPEAWLALGERERLDLVESAHAEALADLPNPTLHCAMHVAILPLSGHLAFCAARSDSGGRNVRASADARERERRAERSRSDRAEGLAWKPLAAAAWIAGVAATGLGWLIAGPANAEAPEPPRRGTLVSTADMRVGRAAHTATTLLDGRVLVAGGFIATGSSKGAEVYEPGAGRFAPLSPMVTPRHSHTATLLPDGKVLIAGGYGEGSVTLAAAELFDPVANTFTPTGSLGAARADHVAIPLENGKVLIAGGLGPGWTFLASAEIYDPVAGRFSPTGSMTTARESHAAVRLPDGRVLVVGGHNGQRRSLTLLASAEIYDPATGAFRRAGAMRIARHKHDAVLLPSGQVLITGGADDRDDRGVYDSTELFDPQTGRSVAGPVMKLGRYKHAGTSVLLPSGLVLIAGGAPQAETFDTASRGFALVPGEPRMAGQFSAVALLRGGGALITGGYGNRTGPRSSAWLYRP